MNPRLLRPTASGRFPGGNLSAASLYDAALLMAKGSPIAPTAGGTLTINSESLGSYDYAIRSGETLASFTAADWFTSTVDTRSAWCVVRGNLTINSGVTFTPPVRKLFLVLVVTGNLTVNGTVSMTARGANHSGTGNSGGATTAAAIRIIDGTFSGVTDPNVPAAGGAGGQLRSGPGTLAGNPGTNGANGGSGGGGGGSLTTGGPGDSGAGAAGTSFSGGPGGGARAGGSIATSGGANGGAGGSSTSSVFANGSGGAGNPGGAKTDTGGEVGQDGTGGVLVVIVLGQLLGTGAISANGSNGGAIGTAGGGSGGGSVTVLAKTDGSSITPAANGGTGPGSGGAGTARKLAL